MGVAIPPDVVRWVSRSGGDGDCAIAAISLATGHTYEQVLQAALDVGIHPLPDGLYTAEVKRILTHLKISWKLKRKKFDLEKDTGILCLQAKNKKNSDHAVYLWAGRIVEPAIEHRSFWLDPSLYLLTEDYSIECLLVLDSSEIV